MSVLYVVPNHYLSHWRRTSLGQRSELAPVSVQSLVAKTLKEGLVVYKEDRILEEVAVWQGVQENAESLRFFAPIAHFPGFLAELHWLFRQLDLGEITLESIPPLSRDEFQLLHWAYGTALKEQGVLDQAGQLREALRLVKENTFFPEAVEIHLWGLGELSPLEMEFLRVFAGKRPMSVSEPKGSEPELEIIKAADPYEEVELMGRAIRAQVEAGVPLERIGLVFPQPRQYLPILHAVFSEQKLPWRMPPTSLRNTPLGKTVLMLIAGELEGWSKHHLQLLTAPGWGFPFGLNADQLRMLHLGPPLKELPAWREYLGSDSDWAEVLSLLTEAGKIFTQPQSLVAYGAWLEEVLTELRPEKWVRPEDDLEGWAELAKAWDGMAAIARSLQAYQWQCNASAFFRLFQSLLDSYGIRRPRTFTQQLQVLRVEQLGAFEYDVLYAGGLVEGQFPPRQYTHWLTKKAAAVQREQFYQRLISAAGRVFLHYPEIDLEGQLNLPSTLLPREKLPKAEEETPQTRLHYPSLYLGRGSLTDETLLAELRERIVQEGMSVSDLNAYVDCPYKFFCSFVLRLRPPEEASLEVGALERGNIIHTVLERFWRSYLTGPLPSLQRAQAEIEGLLREEYGEYGEEPPLSEIRMLRTFIRTDLKVAQAGFRPAHLERRFSGLAVETAEGPVEIRGRIDRIDVSPEGHYVLYDYKTGSAPSGPALMRGEDVQIAAYLLAARDLLPKGQNVGAAYYKLDGKRSGIFHFDHYQRLLIPKGRTCLADDEFQAQIAFFEDKLRQILTDIFAGQFPIEPKESRNCSYCPFQAICRKEVHSA